MPFDVAGNFTRNYNFQQDRDNGIKILAARVDGEFDNFATGMNAVFFRDGRVPMQADLRMNINRVTGIADGNVGSPALKFQTDQTTGPYLDGLSRYAIAVNGVQRAVFTTTGLDVIGALTVGGAGMAPLASPAFTGTPTAPTAAFGTNTTQLATTAFVQGVKNNTALTGTTTIADGRATSGFAINDASGTDRNLFFFTSGVYAASIGLITDNATIKHNATTRHRFDVSGATKLNVDTTGIQVVGTTAWINTDKLLLQHNGSNGYVRAQSGDLNLGGAASNVLTLDSTHCNINGAGQFKGSPNVAIGFTHNRGALPGQAGYHMYNGGAVAEWQMYQPTGGSGSYFGIATSVASVVVDRFVVNTNGDIYFGSTTLGSLKSVPSAGLIEHYCNAHQFRNAAGTELATIGTSGGIPYLTVGGEDMGYRGLPSTSGGALTADRSQRGRMYKATGNVLINNAVFAADDVLTVYNNSAASITLTQGAGVTMRLAGTATTGSRTLVQRGFATIVFISASECVVSGNVS